MTELSTPSRLKPYHYYVREPMDLFWERYGTTGRRALFVGGLGFDPRCIPAARVAFEVFDGAELTTFLARFTNLWDELRPENEKYTEECLDVIRIHRDQHGVTGRHLEVEVNLFASELSTDSTPAVVGDRRLLAEFRDCFSPQELATFTDIIVDVSAFPRSLMYVLISYLWNHRPPGQNLFAVLTEVGHSVHLAERGFCTPKFTLGDQDLKPDGRVIWLPVLGGNIDRLDAIYQFIRPEDVFPIVPFPTDDPRSGDEVVLLSRTHLFDQWHVPFQNVLYASGTVPFDVFRKIDDFVTEHHDFLDELAIVVSALSGRSLSLGVLLAALWNNLFICHSQPTTYVVTESDRTQLMQVCRTAVPTLFWLDGEIYEPASVPRVKAAS